MLGKFLGRDQKPALPKNQIEVVCPVCGAAQYEPRLVVTTFCRKCGEHLRIEGRKIIASAHINPVPSTVFPADISSTGKITVQEEPTPQNDNPVAPNALLPTQPLGEQVPLGLGSMMGFQDDEEPAPTSRSIRPAK
ncbi:MAG: hypothetical protein ACOYMN_06790, partial [Roseimicrobium sp.]